MGNIKEKVLVCITIQQNSKRLIKKGAKIASSLNAELHILHVEKAMSIFEKENAVLLLEELFELGKELGGEVHFVSDKDVATRIVSFINELDITKVVLGQTMKSKLYKLLKKDINSYVSNEANEVEVMIIERKGIEKANTKEQKEAYSS